MAKVTFHLTKDEFFLCEDYLQLMGDCNPYEEEYSDEEVGEIASKVMREIFLVHKNGSCTVTIDTTDKYQCEFFNLSISCSSLSGNLYDDLRSGDEIKVKNAKSLRRLFKSIDKKLDALNCKQLHARWNV